jgi:hypothetical protein
VPQEGNAAQETIENLQARVAALEHDKTSAEEQTTRANAKMTRAASARKEMKVRHSRHVSDILAHLHTYCLFHGRSCLSLCCRNTARA